MLFTCTSLCDDSPPQINRRLIKSVLPLWRYRATVATRSLTLFLGGEGKRKKTHILIGMGQRTCEQASCSTGEKSGRTQVRLRGLSRCGSDLHQNTVPRPPALFKLLLGLLQQPSSHR